MVLVCVFFIVLVVVVAVVVVRSVGNVDVGLRCDKCLESC